MEEPQVDTNRDSENKSLCQHEFEAHSSLFRLTCLEIVYSFKLIINQPHTLKLLQQSTPSVLETRQAKNPRKKYFKLVFQRPFTASLNLVLSSKVVSHCACANLLVSGIAYFRGNTSHF